MARFEWKEATEASAPICVLHHDVRLTDEESEQMIKAIHREDLATIRMLVIRAGTRIEQGEHLLHQLGWMQ